MLTMTRNIEWNEQDRLSALGLPMREIARFPERVIVSRR